MDLEIILDDERHGLISWRAIIRRVYGAVIGTEFCEPDDLCNAKEELARFPQWCSTFLSEFPVVFLLPISAAGCFVLKAPCLGCSPVQRKLLCYENDLSRILANTR